MNHVITQAVDRYYNGIIAGWVGIGTPKAIAPDSGRCEPGVPVVYRRRGPINAVTIYEVSKVSKS